jgi:hypothetical protein
VALLNQNPEEWADAVDFDNALRTLPHLKARFRGTPFLHKSKVPLAEADIDLTKKRVSTICLVTVLVRSVKVCVGYESEVVCLYSYPIATAETCVRRES